MSQIKPSHLLITLVMTLALGGCGDRNSKAVFSPEGGHGAGWIRDHKTAARTDMDSCAECHGVNLDGGVSKVSCMSASAVSGFSCHATTPANNPTGCVSCHGGTGSGPFGTTAPNTRAAHAKHVALTGCGYCHQNAGFGTVNHARTTVSGGMSKATVVMSWYSTAGSGVTYNTDGTCAAVSCHGGLVSPVWQSGSLNMVAKDNALCKKCHEAGTTKGVPQYNSYYSGLRSETGSKLHTFHLNKGFYCTDCHNIGTLTNYQKHYGGLTAKVMTAPENTIGGSPSKVTSYVLATKNCTTATGCHTGGFSASWNN